MNQVKRLNVATEGFGLPTIMDPDMATRYGSIYVQLASFAIDLDRVFEERLRVQPEADLIFDLTGADDWLFFKAVEELCDPHQERHIMLLEDLAGVTIEQSPRAGAVEQGIEEKVYGMGLMAFGVYGWFLAHGIASKRFKGWSPDALNEMHAFEKHKKKLGNILMPHVQSLSILTHSKEKITRYCVE